MTIGGVSGVREEESGGVRGAVHTAESRRHGGRTEVHVIQAWTEWACGAALRAARIEQGPRIRVTLIVRVTCIRGPCPIRPAGRRPAGHRPAAGSPPCTFVAPWLRCLNFSVNSVQLLPSTAPSQPVSRWAASPPNRPVRIGGFLRTGAAGSALRSRIAVDLRRRAPAP